MRDCLRDIDDFWWGGLCLMSSSTRLPGGNDNLVCAGRGEVQEVGSGVVDKGMAIFAKGADETMHLQLSQPC
jgi:hypothetical protein